MPKRQLVLADLDRTLFDTSRFVQDLWAFAGREIGFNGDAERERATMFYRYSGDWYDYRFFDHLASVIDNEYERAAFTHLVEQEMHGRYLFSDVTPDIIELIDAIVTFGNEPYQSFKLLLCPQLEGITPHIILDSKGAYIARTFQTPTVLIDDKPIGDEILPPAQFIRIDRTNSLAQIAADEVVIRSLNELPAVLQNIDRDN